ncbi:Nuclear GTPase SLIP-GC, partial [Anabarilius grahami]
FAVITLQDTDEVMVAASDWLSTDKKQCYWPPFKSTEKYLEAVKNNLGPLTEGKPWEMLNVIFHAEYDNVEGRAQSRKFEEMVDLSESFLSTKIPDQCVKDNANELNVCAVPSFNLPLDMEIMLKAKQINKRVNDSLVNTNIMHREIISKINQLNNVSRKKATIGIFGTSGEGKSSLLSAILGEKYLLPSGCFGACTAVVTQVEANLTDSNYIAEIELFSKEEWEKEMEDLFRVLSDESEDRDDELFEIAVEKITALYGADADKKTLEELKKDDKFAEIETLLSVSKKTISVNDINEFMNEVESYIQSESCLGNWYSLLVKSVKIKIPNCRELLEHIVLVDLSGSGDCNKTGDDLWKSKLSDCSFVWIISSINRASTDSGPWGILKHCTEELGPGGECKHINFICTKTDDINPGAYVSVTGKTGKSVQEQIDKFSIIQSDSAYPSSPIQHIENFIKTEETKLTQLLERDIVDMKKLIYSSIQITIQNEITSCYKGMLALKGRFTQK